MMFAAGVILGALVTFLLAPPAARWRAHLWSRLGGQSESVRIEELREVIDERLSAGEVAREEQDMLGGLLRLRDAEAEELMVHRTKMTQLDAGKPADELAQDVLKSGHTRFPVWQTSPDNIIGILHSRSLFAALGGADGEAVQIDKLLRPPWFVPAATRADMLLRQFLEKRQQLALVIDEYGEIMGLVTLEDVLEEIVGEITDENERVANGIRQQKNGSYLIDGAVPIRDITRALGWQLPDAEATTIAGLIIHEARMIPSPGQAFTFHGFRFEVVKKRRHQLTVIRATPLGEAEGARG